MLEVHWHECEFPLKTKGQGFLRQAVLETAVGVYVIERFYDYAPDYTVYVGSGEIKNRLREHANDSNITQHEGNEPLRAFWAASGQTEAQREGIERYLADRLDPKVGSRHPEAAPVEVNLPALLQVRFIR